MNSENLSTNTSLASGFGLAQPGTTCYAPPIVLVTLGINTAIFVVAVFAAYALLPLVLWLEG